MGKYVALPLQYIPDIIEILDNAIEDMDIQDQITTQEILTYLNEVEELKL